ncbi:MAG: NAD(P)-dependent glycerol-3-phosphate dehydrogenase [Candidatus Omnitrophota bacterium]|nr:MAG: NAD(P)-dependent glycerol-3-phosphate dehydrogenase [Candidatus Omnitrophota bacterium]
MKEKIAVLGDGGWGTTIAILLSSKGYDVTLWGAFPDYIALLQKERINRKFLPGIKIPEAIHLTSDINRISRNSIFVIAIPSKYLRKTISGFKGKVGGKIISLTKGIETETLKRPSEIISEVLGLSSEAERRPVLRSHTRKQCGEGGSNSAKEGGLKISVLSGPSISFEVARNLPTTLVAASDEKIIAKETQAIFTTPNFRVYTSSDLTGVELGGALKNIIAIAAGISDGMGFGVNTKAALLTRGLAEIIRLGAKLGAEKETFFGLSGLGDLATTCVSTHSRNRRLGEEIGKGKKLKDILKETEMIMEGITTTKSTYELSKKIGVEMPITEKIYEVLYAGKNPKDAVKELMTRPLKAEGI